MLSPWQDPSVKVKPLSQVRHSVLLVSISLQVAQWLGHSTKQFI